MKRSSEGSTTAVSIAFSGIGDTSVGYHAFKTHGLYILPVPHIRGYANHLYLRQSYSSLLRYVV